MESFEKHSILGEGQFGKVWLVSVTLPGNFGKQSFALKAQKKDDPYRGDSVDEIRQEIDVLGQMDHPYIVNLIHHYEDPEHLYILMGLVYGGELFDVIHSEQEDGTWTSGLPESDSKFYAMVLTDTLDYIHRKHFVFRDLKPENVLIDREGYPVICDFGFGKASHNGQEKERYSKETSHHLLFCHSQISLGGQNVHIVRNSKLSFSGSHYESRPQR